MAPHREVVVEPNQPVKFSLGTIVAIITAAFILGTTFTNYAVKFEVLSDRVDRLASMVENHLSSPIATTTLPKPPAP
jgi:hypothetical protein